MILKRKSQTRQKSIQASSAFLKEHCFSASSCRSAKWLLLEKNFLRMKPLPDWLLKTNGCCQSISTISFLVWTIHHIRNAPRKEKLSIKIPSPRSASRYRLLQIRKKMIDVLDAQEAKRIEYLQKASDIASRKQALISSLITELSKH